MFRERNLDGSGEIVRDGVLNFFPQRGASGGKPPPAAKLMGVISKARIETAAAIEADLLSVEFVEIMKDAADSESFVSRSAAHQKRRARCRRN